MKSPVTNGRRPPHATLPALRAALGATFPALRSALGAAATFLALVLTLAPAPARAAAPVPDTVTLRDGGELRCRVLSVDANKVLVEKDDGAQQALPRVQVQRIEFGEAAVAPPIVARVRVLEGDDVVRILLDGTEVASAAALRAGWVDLAPLLKEGPNRLVAEVRNDGGVWAYRWIVEGGTKKEVFACGLANRSGCREQGGDGLEKGTFPAGNVWIYVHRSAGDVTLQR